MRQNSSLSQLKSKKHLHSRIYFKKSFRFRFLIAIIDAKASYIGSF